MRTYKRCSVCRKRMGKGEAPAGYVYGTGRFRNTRAPLRRECYDRASKVMGQ